MSISEYLKKRKLNKLKAKVRSLYIQYVDYGNAFDCGLALEGYISSRMANNKVKLNAAIAELKKLDPSCPDFNVK